MFKFLPDQRLTLQSAVYQAVGAATVAWDHPDRAGSYRPDKAGPAAEALLDVLAEMGLSRDTLLPQSLTVRT